MRKVLVILNNRGTGGAERIAETVAKELDLAIFYLTEHLATNKYVTFTSNIIFGTKSSNYKINFKIISNLIAYCKNEKIEILYPQLGISLFYSIIAKLTIPRLKIIYHEHGEILYNRQLQFFMKFVSVFISKIIVVTNELNSSFKSVDKSKITCIENFIDNRFFLNTIHIKNKIFTLGFIGRLTEVKGIDILLSALQRMQFPWVLNIAGEGPCLKMIIESKERLKKYGSINILGFTDTLAVLQQCDLLVSPSRSESFGLTIAEAMASGVPVVSSNLHSLESFVINNKSAITFESENAHQLAEKITAVSNNDYDLSNITQQAKAIVAKFSHKNFFTKLNEVIQNV
jgi:glycosyltransferase involved in cell wall biosynthesis